MLAQIKRRTVYQELQLQKQRLTLMEEKSFKWSAFFVIVEVEPETDFDQFPEEVLVGVTVGTGQQLVDVLNKHSD